MSTLEIVALIVLIAGFALMAVALCFVATATALFDLEAIREERRWRAGIPTDGADAMEAGE